MERKMIEYNDFRTLTGFTLAEATEKLKEVLPPEAYKPVPTATYLTDIDPSYLTEYLTTVFGACGVGWTFSWSDDTVALTAEERKSSKGREYTEHTALIPSLAFKYLYYNGEFWTWSEPIYANGGNSNEDQAYAVRGAITNALGAAASKLCWQLPVYQGKVNHKNAAQKQPKQPVVKKAAATVRNANGDKGEAITIEAPRTWPGFLATVTELTDIGEEGIKNVLKANGFNAYTVKDHDKMLKLFIPKPNAKEKV